MQCLIQFKFCLLFVLFLSYKCEENLSLQSDGSTIVGRKMKTLFNDKDYVAYWKIPYAEPPVGDLRFKAPKSTTWLGEEKSYDYSQPYNLTCAQGMTEDCLYLSLFVPLTDIKIKSHPVLVWLHEDSNLHSPDFLIDEDVIVVMVSFRTTIFGFLNTEDDFAPGNMGAKDVLLALKWVKDNIVLFDGNPDKITIMGGGIASNLAASLLLSKSAEDVYSRAIILSGSALSPADYASTNLEAVNKLHSKFYGPIEKLNRQKLYTSLTDASTSEMLTASEDIFDSSEVRDRQRLINSFGLTVEKNKNSSFISRKPIDIYKSKLNNNNVDVMFGFTTLPSLYKLKGIVNNRKLLTYLNYNFQYLLPFEGRADEFESNRYRKIRQRIMDFYFLNGTIGERSLRRYARYASDQVIYPLIRQSRLQAESSCKNVYLHRFTFKGLLNFGWMSSVRQLNWSGTTSGDEICYLFKCKTVNDIYDTVMRSTERYFIKRIARLLANFIDSGNPTPISNDELLGDLKWEPLDSKPSSNLRGLNFKRNPGMTDFPEETRMKFWDELRNEFFVEKNLLQREEL